jgi:hypothetical protein
MVRRFGGLLRLGHIGDRHAPPFKMVEEGARIGALVRDHDRAVLLAGQDGPKFVDQLLIGIRHQWLLCLPDGRGVSCQVRADWSPEGPHPAALSQLVSHPQSDSAFVRLRAISQ